MIFNFLLLYKSPFSGNHRLPIELSVLFILFHITMPKNHKIHFNCIWHVPPDWFGLKFNSALLTQVYRKYATYNVRVCVSSKSPNNHTLPFTKKSNLQVKFGSRGRASLYELLCHHFLTRNDPLLDELHSYLPTRFLSHIFDCIAYDSSDNESVRSIDSSVSVFYSDESTYLC